MENSIDNAIDLGAEVVGNNVSDVVPNGKANVIIKVAGGVLVLVLIGFGVKKLIIDPRKAKKGIIDGEILSVETDVTEE